MKYLYCALRYKIFIRLIGYIVFYLRNLLFEFFAFALDQEWISLSTEPITFNELIKGYHVKYENIIKI